MSNVFLAGVRLEKWVANIIHKGERERERERGRESERERMRKRERVVNLLSQGFFCSAQSF